MNSKMKVMFQHVMTQVRAHADKETEDTIGCGKCYACVTGGRHPCGLATMFVVGEEADEDITCENCGNCWDGFAQCSCLGIPLIEDDDDDDEDERVWGGYSWDCQHCKRYKIHSCKSEKAGLCLDCYSDDDVRDYSTQKEVRNPRAFSVVIKLNPSVTRD